MMELPVTRMSRIVMPASTNDAGNLYGGRLLDWMDEVSGIAAKRFAHSEVMTVGIESIRFMRPMPQGSFIDINAEVVHVGNTSIEDQDHSYDGSGPGRRTGPDSRSILYLCSCR